MKTLLANSRSAILFLLSIVIAVICLICLISFDFTGLQFKGMVLIVISLVLNAISFGISIYSKTEKNK
ncbi:hypothetical protein [Arcicella rigui]|uniref:NADH dehydrogenase subunit 4L n=1 Tax=Arcicella rigui TaxID=797020 RepID=A0ABU5Q6S0_9BACT|nr:hypothetical protein [Arcicella rigui]MEA5138298.1 hypothetical protein [Arcicella rigui]